MKLLLIIIVLLISSCASVRKSSTSSASDHVHIDTSSQEHKYSRETTTEEKGSMSVTTHADSAQTSGTMSAEDTNEYRQEVETDGISLSTTIKPRVNNGKVTGYQVHSKAVAKPKVVNIPVDRRVTTKETGTDKQQTGITDTKKEVITTSKKERTGFNGWGSVAIVGVIIIFLLFVFSKLWK